MMKGYQIAILDMNAGVPNQGLRCIEHLVAEFLGTPGQSGSYKIYDVRNTAEVPDIQAYDIFIASGGPGSPKPKGVEWEQQFFNFLDGIREHNHNEDHKKHLFLVCHSFQLACLHWKFGTISRRKSMAFGIMPIHKTREGRTEPLFEGLADPFYAVDSREYQVLQPDAATLEAWGAAILCREKIRPHIDLERAIMGIRFSEEIVGMQFHPEADPDGMRMYFKKPAKRKHIIKHHGKEKYQHMLQQLDDNDKLRKTNSTIIPRFLKQAARALNGTKMLPV